MELFVYGQVLISIPQVLPHPAFTCSKSAKEIEQCYSCRFGVFLINFDQILFNVFPFLTLDKKRLARTEVTFYTLFSSNTLKKLLPLSIKGKEIIEIYISVN